MVEYVLTTLGYEKFIRKGIGDDHIQLVDDLNMAVRFMSDVDARAWYDAQPMKYRTPIIAVKINEVAEKLGLTKNDN